MTPLEIVKAAQAAALTAAQAQWIKDGQKDVGYCGGAMLQLRGNSKVAKAALGAGLAKKIGSQTFVRNQIPEGISTQHATVYIEAMLAFKAVIDQHDPGATSKFWTYAD